jgi:methoxymalonate biosynthesis acyl carrier protein
VVNRKVKIKEFLSRFSRNHDLGDDEDIFALGFINSLAALQLVQFLEKEFQIAIEDEDLDLDNFRTLNRIDDLLERKLTCRTAV